MKIKSLGIILAMLILSACSNSKNVSNKATTNKESKYKAQFETDIRTYLEEFNQRNWENVLEYINPKLFSLAPKSTIISTFQQVTDMGMNMHTDFKEVKNISKPISYQDTLYCQVFYRGDITIVLDKELVQQAALLEEEFKSSYGNKSVSYDKNKNTFLIRAERSMMAVSVDDGQTWKYLEFNKKDMKLIELLIPEKIINQMKI